MSFEWKPFSQKAVHSLQESTCRINVWEGSVRSGKTISSIIRWIQYVQSQPANAKLLMIGKSERTLKRNILDVIIEMVGPKNACFKYGTGEFLLFGRPIDCVGANDERSSDKIRGMTCAGAYVDEVTLVPESFWAMLMSRLSVKGAKCFCTTNPDGPMHWFKVQYLDREDELDLIRFHFTLDDNPSLDPDYVRSLKKEYTGLWFKRFIQGLWVMAEGAIYQQWDEKVHAVRTQDVVRELARAERSDRKQFRNYAVGVDYGTNNPCAFVMVGFDRFDGPKYVVKEYYWNGRRAGKQKTDSDYARDLQDFMDGYRVSAIMVDPSALSFLTELRRQGINPTAANNDVLDGIRYVSSQLSTENLFVDRNNCPSLCAEFASYVWDEKAGEKGEDKPKKENDHALDALRYVMMYFGKGRGGIVGGFNRK